MRLHATGCGGSAGSKWKISITAPPGIRIQPILHVPPSVDAEESPHAIGRRVGDADERAPEDVPPEADCAVEIRNGDAGMAEGTGFHGLWLMKIIGGNVIGHS